MADEKEPALATEAAPVAAKAAAALPAPKAVVPPKPTPAPLSKPKPTHKRTQSSHTAPTENNAAEEQDNQIEKLCEAARDGDLKLIRQLVDAGVPVDGNYQMPGKGEAEVRAPVLEAASEGQDHVIKLLHDLGANVEVQNEDGQHAVHYVASSDSPRRVETLQLLYDLGANPDTRNVHGETALQMAAAEGKDDIVTELLSMNAQAAKEGNPPVVDLNATSEDDWTCLHWAASGGHDTIIPLLVEAGADIEAMTHQDQSPITTAVLAAHIATIKVLLENGANIHVVGKNSMTLLDNAMLGGEQYNDVIDTLIRLGHKVTFHVVGSAISKKLKYASHALMKAYIQRGHHVDYFILQFIEKHFQVQHFETVVIRLLSQRVGNAIPSRGVGLQYV
jgi:ankyrin repeat protein